MFELAAQLQSLSGDTTQNQLVCKLKQSKKKRNSNLILAPTSKTHKLEMLATHQVARNQGS